MAHVGAQPDNGSAAVRRSFENQSPGTALSGSRRSSSDAVWLKQKPLLFNFKQRPFEGPREALLGNTRCLESTNEPPCLGSPLLRTTASHELVN